MNITSIDGCATLSSVLMMNIEPMEKKISKDKIFELIMILLWIGFGVFVYFGKAILGVGIMFTLIGIVMLVGLFFNAKPLLFSISGFDYAMKLLFKEYHNKYFNFTWGLLYLLIGITALVNFFSVGS